LPLQFQFGGIGLKEGLLDVYRTQFDAYELDRGIWAQTDFIDT